MKALAIVLLLALFTISLYAQQTVIFKPVYQPRSAYKTTKEMKMVMTMDGGTGENMNMDMNNSTSVAIQTGAPDNNNTYTIRLSSTSDRVSMTMNGQDMSASIPAPPPVIMYGKYVGGKKLLLDSVSGQKIPDSLKAMSQSMMAGVLDAVSFPDHPLKVGESFTQDAPFAIPMLNTGNNGGSKVKTTYKLISIANNLAVFEFEQTIAMDLNPNAADQKMNMKMNGTGNGILSYNISGQYLATMVDTVTMEYDMNINGVAMKGKSTISTNDKTDLVVK